MIQTESWVGCIVTAYVLIEVIGKVASAVTLGVSLLTLLHLWETDTFKNTFPGEIKALQSVMLRSWPLDLRLVSSTTRNTVSTLATALSSPLPVACLAYLCHTPVLWNLLPWLQGAREPQDIMNRRASVAGVTVPGIPRQWIREEQGTVTVPPLCAVVINGINRHWLLQRLGPKLWS